MTCHRLGSGAIELYFYGELPKSDRAAIDAHLNVCGECRQALEDLALIRDALAAQPQVSAPPGGDWSGFMARLDAAIHEPATHAASGGGRSASRVIPWLAAAALLVLVIGAAWLAISQTNAPSQQPPGRAEATDRPATHAAHERPALDPDPALVALSDQHFERSKLVVLGLATKDVESEATADWTYERELASTLLGDTRLYRRAAEERGMETLAGVMRDLELVLLQTSMTTDTDRESLEQLQRLIRRRDLLTKMNAVYHTSVP